jgi:integrase
VLDQPLMDLRCLVGAVVVADQVQVQGFGRARDFEAAGKERLAPQTIHRYQASLRTAILPALGSLRIREASVGRLDKFLRAVAKDHPSAAKGAKVVLGQMFALAVRHGAIPANPVRDTGRLRRPRRRVVALTLEHLQAVRTAIRGWQRPTPGKPGPRPTGDLADIVDLMLATGARIGEIPALRGRRRATRRTVSGLQRRPRPNPGPLPRHRHDGTAGTCRRRRHRAGPALRGPAADGTRRSVHCGVRRRSRRPGQPALTAVRPPRRSLGRAAARLVADRLSDRE